MTPEFIASFSGGAISTIAILGIAYVVRYFHRNPSQRVSAGVKRTGKTFFFTVFGTVVSNASAIAATSLIGLHASPEAIAAIGFIVGSLAAGIHKSVNWQALGVDDPNVPTPTLQNPQ